MTQRLTRLSTLAAAQLALAAPAFADMGPQDTWTFMQDYMTRLGYDLTADMTDSGGSMTLDNMTMTMEIPVDDGSSGVMEINLGSMTLEDQGDGTTLISIPPTMPFSIDGDAPEGEEDFSLRGEITSIGYGMIVSGDPDNAEIAYGAQKIDLSLLEFESEEDGVMPVPGEISFSLSEMEGGSVFSTDDGLSIVQSMTLGALSYIVDVTSPDDADEPGELRMSGMLRTLELDATTMVPEGLDVMDFVAAFKGGYGGEGTMTYASGSTELSFEGEDDDDQPMAFSYVSSSDGGDFTFALNDGSLLYDIVTNNLSFAVRGSELPFPVETTAEQVGFGLNMPLVASDGETDFGLSITLAGVVVPDMLWGGIDPQGQLPRDPVTVQLDLSGAGELFVDLIDEAQMTQLGETGGMPGQVNALSVDNLEISAAGASITGTADVTVDNGAMSPLGPFPNAFGTADLRFNGVNGLLSTLGNMGLLPMPQVMMASGMITQLGRPDTGPDDLTARVVLGPDGTLTVNDTPIPLQ